MRTHLWAADEGTLRRWDAIAVLWVTLWLVVGAAVGYEIWQFTGLSQSTVQSGQSLQRVGEALRGFSGTPVIGDETARIGDQVAATGSGIVSSGVQAGSSIRGLSVLIGLAIAAIPVGSALAFYVPNRSRRRRDTAGLSAALARDGLTSSLEGYLAQRAVARLTAGDLLTVTDDPYGDLVAGRHRALAVAELNRVGIDVVPSS
jgi:hypothetical protein